MSRLDVTSHVIEILNVLGANAAADADALDGADAEQMGRRYDLFNSCQDLVYLLDEDESFARTFAEAVVAKHAARAAARHPEDAVLAAEAAELSDRAKDLRIHKAMGDLIARVPSDMRFDFWTWHNGEIDAMYAYHGSLYDEARTDLWNLAELLGFSYEEKAHSKTNHKVCVSGVIDGIPVELWLLIDSCGTDCPLHTEQAAERGQDEDQPATPARGHGQDDGAEACTGTCCDRGYCAFGHDEHLATRATEEDHVLCDDLWPCTEGAALDAVLGLDDEPQHVYTDDQLDGSACVGCGRGFGNGEASVPLDDLVDGHQLFRHTQACPDAREQHDAERIDEEIVICVQCTAARGAQILWPCLRKAALDVAEDFGTTPPAPSTGVSP